MPTPATPSAPKPAGDDRHLVRVDDKYAALGFEDRLRLFWEKNSGAVTAVLVVILLAIVAKGGWEYLAAQNEKDVQAAYAAAATPEQLRTFAAANPRHPLAGVAQLRVADEAYAAGNYVGAIGAYQEAAASLKTGPLASRAQLGSAMAKLLGGREAEGETELKALAADAAGIKVYRAEAIGHLASRAFAKGNSAEVASYSDQLMRLDPASPWVQRLLQLRAAAPVAEYPAAAPAANAPAIKLPATAK